MHKEYLDNIAGSPHVDEGLGDQLYARGASGLQRLSAMTGGPIDDLNHRKVSVLFNTFTSRLVKILKDFAEGDHSIANRLEQMRPQITPVQRDIIEQLRELYSLLVPSQIQQHQMTQALSNQPPRSSFTELLKEGIFNRDLGLNKALQTNNATTILNAYIAEIKKAYDSFVRDAMKVTGAPRDYIKRVVSKFDKKWLPILNKVESISTSNPTQQSATGSTAVPGQPSTTVASTPATLPEVPPTEVPAPEPKTNEEDFALIISNVIDIIVNAVRGDVERSAPFFKAGSAGKEFEELPQDWDAPSVTKEEVEEPTTTPDVKEAPPGEPNEFLYNFHSLYRKQRHFAIQLPQSSEFTYKSRHKNELNKVDVIWGNNAHANMIFVKYTPVKVDTTANGEKIYTPTGKSGDMMLFKFWDDQVNPRNETGKQFSVKMILDQANRNSTYALEKASKSNPQLVKNINNKTDKLQRALYATVSRKRMEFKPKKPISLELKDGNVYQKGKLVPADKLKQYMYSSSIGEAKHWIEALDEIDYFTVHPEMLEIRNKADAILKLIDNNILHSSAIEAVSAVTQGIKGADGLQAKSAADFEVDNLVTLAKQYLLQKKEFPKNAQDAIDALVSMGASEADTADKMKTVVSLIGPDAKVEDYVAAVTKEPKLPAGNKPTVPATATATTVAPVAPETSPTEEPKAVSKPEPVKSSGGISDDLKASVSISDDGIITFKNPKSNEMVSRKLGHMLPKWVGQVIVSNPKLNAKLEDLIKQRAAAKAAKTNKPKTDLEESIVNPFNRSNFI